MRPPPLPIFTGQSIVALPQGDFVIVRPRGVPFREPKGTSTLLLPTATLAAVEAADDALVFTGDFRRVDRPSSIRLSPVAPADATGLVAAFGRKLGLPRRAREIDAAELTHPSSLELVTVVGSFRAGHSEAPNFEGVYLAWSAPLEAARFRVTGFLHPAPKPGDHGSRGYGGATLFALSVMSEAGSDTRAFSLGGKRVAFERLGPSAWRVTVDGHAVPMTFRETESTSTNSGYYDSVLREDHLVQSLPVDALMAQREAFETEQSGESWKATCRWKASSVALYNTVIYDLETVTLRFPTDFSAVHIDWNHYSDTSS